MNTPRPSKFDLAVIGAGAAGLSLAAGAARLGLRTVLFELGEMGGDCLNAGCVPSKAFLAAAARIAARKSAGAEIALAEAFDEAMAQARRAVETIAPHDSQERFEGLGVQVVRARASFSGHDSIFADGVDYRARRIAIATGSRPHVPDIPGLHEIEPLTNETLWRLRAPPRKLAILGAGPMGVELAQAFARLGVEVVLIERAARLLPTAPVANSEAAARLLTQAGVTLKMACEVTRAERNGEGARLHLEGAAIEVDAVLVATGRRINLDGLDPEAAGVAVEEGRIVRDRRLRTSNKRVFVIGDAGGGAFLTHAAGYEASVALRNIAFRTPARASGAIPAAVYCDPELAWIGPPAALDAPPAGARLARWAFADNDRAVAEGRCDGEIAILAKGRGRILAASASGPGAGEQISLIALAMQSGLKLSALAGMIAPYPTRAEAIKRAAGAWYEPLVFGSAARWAVGLLAKLP